MTPQSGRKKAQYGRSRSKKGCITCKIRRVKCDENYPSCQRCTSSGRRCDGYEKTSPSPTETALVRQPSHLPGGMEVTHREMRAFHFFLESTAPTLSGPLDSKFWVEFVPQLSQSVPAVWDALITIGSLVEHPQWNSEPAARKSEDLAMLTNTDYRWALGMYNRSISKLNISAQNDSSMLPIAIITCVLFICIEFLQDNVQNSFKLFSVAERLINEFELGDSYPSDLSVIIRETIYPLFNRLSVMMAFIFQNSFLKLVSSPRLESNSSFANLSEARSSLYAILASFHDYYDRSVRYKQMENIHLVVPADLQIEQERNLARLYEWHSAFSDLNRSTDPNLDGFTSSLCLVHYNAAVIHMSASLSPFETSFDSSMHLFESMVRHAETTIKSSPHHRHHPKNSPGRPSFIFDSNIISPLYFVATQCRHPEIRRHAVRLIHESANKDGLCKSTALGRMAEIAIDIEEEGLEFLTMPVEEKRIHNRRHEYREVRGPGSTKHKRLYLTYTRYSQDEHNNWILIEGQRPMELSDESESQQITPPPKYRFKHYSPPPLLHPKHPSPP